MVDRITATTDSAAQAGKVDGTGRSNARSSKRWRVVFIVALVVFIASLSALGAVFYSYLQGQQKYDALEETSGIDVSGLSEGSQLGGVTVDWDALMAVNPDTVGWVYLPDSPINYPVVQGSDNDHYLYYDFDGDAGWLAEYGCIFLDYRNNAAFLDQANFIYGHNMNDGSMFAIISQMADQAEFDKHRIVYLLTPYGNYRLRSFSLIRCSATDPIVQTSFADKKEMRDYVQDKIDRSIIDATDIPKAADIGKVYAFATCDNTADARYVLFTYVLDTTATGLEGEVGLDANRNSTWFVDDLTAKE